MTVYYLLMLFVSSISMSAAFPLPTLTPPMAMTLGAPRLVQPQIIPTLSETEEILVNSRLQLFLKPLTRLHIVVTLPEIKLSAMSVSNWEIMEKLKTLVKPEPFEFLNVVNLSRESVTLEAEFSSVKAMRRSIPLLSGQRFKHSNFTDLLSIKIVTFDTVAPVKTEWEAIFRDKGMISFQTSPPGDRPDTIRLENLPIAWFSETVDPINNRLIPSTKILREAFERFGGIRRVEIIADAPPSEDGANFNSFGPGHTQNQNMTAYIQYFDYQSFCNSMEGLRDRKLVKKAGDAESAAFINLSVDMTSYLSDENVKKRLRQQEKRNELQKLLEQKKWLEEQLDMHSRMEEETQQQEHKTRISFLAQQKNTFEYISRKSIFRPYHNPYNQGNPRRMKPRPPREEVERATEMSTYQLRYSEAKSLLGFLLVGAAEARNEEQKERKKGKSRDKYKTKYHSHDRDNDKGKDSSSSIEMFQSDSDSQDKSSVEVEMRQRLKNRFKSHTSTSSKNKHSDSDNEAH